MSASPHDPVSAVLALAAAAWDAGDAAAYAGQFTEDATYVVFDGTVLRGRTAIEETHRWLFDGPLRGSRSGGAPQDSDMTLRVVAPGVAHVVLGGAIVPAGAVVTPGELPAGRASTVSYLLVDGPDRWRIAAFHNTRRAS